MYTVAIEHTIYCMYFFAAQQLHPLSPSPRPLSTRLLYLTTEYCCKYFDCQKCKFYLCPIAHTVIRRYFLAVRICKNYKIRTFLSSKMCQDVSESTVAKGHR